MPHTRRRNHENSHKELCCQPSHPVPSHLKCSLPTHVNLPLGKHPYDISMRRSQIRWLQEPKPVGKSVQKFQSAKSWVAGLISKRQHHALICNFRSQETNSCNDQAPAPCVSRSDRLFHHGPLQNTLPQSAVMWSTGAQGDCEGSYLNHFCWLPQLSDNALLAVCTKILGNPTASMFSSDSVCPFPFCLILERSHSKMQLQ